MNKEQREKLEQGIESCKSVERQFRALRGILEIAKACDDVSVMTEQLKALSGEMDKARATVHDINEARKATKQ